MPFTKYLWLKSPWRIAALPLRLKEYESTALEEVMCRVLGPLLQDGSLPKSPMICSAEATHPESYSTTGRGSYKLYTSATCVCLPTRPSSVPKLPLFSAGSGMLAPFLPVSTVLTPSPRTGAEHCCSLKILHWCLQSFFPCYSKVLKLPRSTGCCNSRSSFSGIY